MRLAWRLFWREWRGGELGLLLISLVLGVAIVTGISLFADRLQQGLQGEGNAYLGGDRVLMTPEPVDPAWLSKAAAVGVQSARTVVFPTMAYAGDISTLASLKAVTANYPLRGELGIRQGAGVLNVKKGPAQGTAWVDETIAAQLDLSVNDLIDIGNIQLRVEAILVREGDAGSSFYGMGARVLMSDTDLPATGLLMPGSRVEYRYLFAGAQEAVVLYMDWLKPKLSSLQRLVSLGENQPGIAGALDKAMLFLRLAGSLGVLLAALAGGFAAQRYCERHVDAIAVFKTLGAGRQKIMGLLMQQMIFVWVLSVLGGLCVGVILHLIFLEVLTQWVPANLPAPGWRALLPGGMTSLVCMLTFILPAYWRLLQVPPSLVLRQSRFQSSLAWTDVLWMLLGVCLVLLLYSHSLTLVAYLLSGLFGLLILITLFSMLMLSTIKPDKWHARHAVALGLANARRRGAYSLLQVVVFATGFMLLLVMLLLRTSLLREWQMQIPPDAPNTFLINIAPEQMQDLERTLSAEGMKTAGLYPMVRGRLVRINGQEATALFDQSVSELYRELNLSWSNTLPEGNTLEAGVWNETGQADGVSIEKGLAKRLQLQVGDRLAFSIGGNEVEAKITSIRSLHWDRMTPNFYFLFTEGMLDSFSWTGMTSVHTTPLQKPVLMRLLRGFPSVTAYPVDELISRIRSIVERASLAVELVLVLVLVAGVLVLVSCVRASLDQRLHESALLRTLGATRGLVVGSVAVEFLVLGAMAGVLAAAGAEISCWVLQSRLLNMPAVLHPMMWICTPLVSAATMSLVGTWFCYKAVVSPPQVILRENLG